MTIENRNNILNKLDEVYHPYANKVMDCAPNLKELVDIEGICLAWVHLEEMGRRNVTFEQAVKQYRKEYERDSAMVKRMTGKDMPPLKLDLSAGDIVINEDLTAATIESIQKTKRLIDAAKRFDETGVLFGDMEEDRFYGTIPYPEIWKKMEEVNRKLDVIATEDSLTVEKFEKPNPRSRSATVAIVQHDTVVDYTGTILKAYKEIVKDADEIVVVAVENGIRTAFSFDGVWKEYRNLTDEEMEELDAELFDDMEDGSDDAEDEIFC